MGRCVGFTPCAASLEQRLLARTRLAQFLRPLSTTSLDLMNRPRCVRIRMSGGVREGAGDRSLYSIAHVGTAIMAYLNS